MLGNNTKRFMLKTQFATLIENYIDQYSQVVKFCNKYCSICFEPDVDTDKENSWEDDIISPILNMLNFQKGNKGKDCTEMKMLPFIKAVRKDDYCLPKSVKELAVKEKQTLKELCYNLSLTYDIFGAVGQINPAYSGKESYVIKRVTELYEEPESYNDQGSSQNSYY